jgi:hypothetical protein
LIWPRRRSHAPDRQRGGAAAPPLDDPATPTSPADRGKSQPLPAQSGESPGFLTRSWPCVAAGSSATG